MTRNPQPAPLMREEINRYRKRPMGAPMATRCPRAAQLPAGTPLATYPRQDGEQRRATRALLVLAGLLTLLAILDG